MAQMIKFRFYCQDCAEQKYAWLPEPPQDCPVDAEHTIDEDSIVVVELGDDDLQQIHWKLGWHMQEVRAAGFTRPKELLVYYGWLSGFNNAANGWNNELIAQDMAKYDIIVFGDGVQAPGHGDYANSQAIITRVKALNPGVVIFGYASANQDRATFEAKAAEWNTLGVHGIFLDEAGYEFGRGRAEFNEKVSYVHAQSVANLCCVNAWNMDHIIGTEDDPSYPNANFNPNGDPSKLTAYDWYMLESFPINTAAYTSSNPPGYESKGDWAVRGVKALNHRVEYGINLVGVGIINNDNAQGGELFDFGFVSALMFSLDGFGTSDVNYGASSATVTRWPRPDLTGLGRVYSINPSVQANPVDWDVYLRYVEHGRLSLDFSDGGQVVAIEKR